MYVGCKAINYWNFSFLLSFWVLAAWMMKLKMSLAQAMLKKRKRNRRRNDDLSRISVDTLV